ncbi:MAG TPA: TonB-dependent siderophore receptor [Stenotrophomonas sp.]|jgi:iron complex outermembrane receptor protein|uniref:TonB-dependent siderophore receptor n=1 Tax=unclassified Stenotrophomonas TaxID=196198 RepID=UPI000E8BD648|nr:MULTISPECIES: TonB-dependent receptor [unclassified Stenotrophomonas]HBS64247.1 TonB-dependent siderophore receptor [Stenotrophomonas sp.]
MNRPSLRFSTLGLALTLASLPAHAAPPSSDAVQLDTVQVLGRAQTLYRVDDAAVGTRTDTPLALVPQSIQVVPRELIEDQAARYVTDLYRSISGISFFSYAGVTMRGFRQENVLYDGLRGDPYAGFSVPQLFNIERVEVLKGPAGALYGGGDAGGVINYVTRKPKATPERRIELQAGNNDFSAASIDATGPMNAAGSVRYRAGLYSDAEQGVRWNADSESVIGDASLAVDVGDTGELTLQFTDITQNLGGNRLRGVPVDDAGNFLTDRRWNHNEASDFLDMRARVALAQYRFAPRDNLDVDVAARWFSNNEHQMYHEPMGLIDRDRDGVAAWMTRQLRNQIRDNEAFTANANAVWRINTGSIGHTMLFGADVYQLDADFTAQTANSADLARGAGPVHGIDLFNPVYGASTWHDYNLAALPWRSTSTRSKRYGAYLQDELALTARWHVLAGLRWDGFKDDDRIGGSRVDGNDLSWRLGSTVTVREGLNFYANVASGFVPQSAANQNPAAGGPFDAERSRQWEVGMKSLLADRVTLNMAAYRIDRSNIVQATGDVVDGVNQLAALGLVRSTGMELDLLADVTERWVVNLTYAYNDARVKDMGPTGITNASGDRFANAPQNKLGLWTRYDLPAINSAIGFGADHVGERVSLDGQAVKAYTVFDMSWKTTWKQWQYQANVKNLFDRVYAASGFTERTGHFPGEPRRVYVQAAYAF